MTEIGGFARTASIVANATEPRFNGESARETPLADYSRKPTNFSILRDSFGHCTVAK